MTYVVHFPYNWPEKMPKHSQLTDDAQKLGKTGEDILTAYDDAATQWGGLPSALTVEGDEKLFMAFTTNVAPYADTVNTSLTETKKALKDFAGEVEGFKPRWQNLKSEVATYNALEAEPDVDADKVDGVSYRTYTESNDLSQRLMEARDDYVAMVGRCVTAIENADPSLDPLYTNSGLKGFLEGTKKQWNRARTTLQVGAGFNGHDGKIGFKFNADSPVPTSITEVMRGRIPKWLPEDVKTKLESYLPENPARYQVAPDGSVMRYANGDPIPAFVSWSDRFRRSSVGQLMKDKFNWRLRGVTDATGTKTRFQLNTNIRMPGWAQRGSRGLRKVEGAVKKIEGNKYVKGAGKVFGVAEAIGGYADGYAEGYNNSLRDHPDRTPGEHQREAATSSAVRGTTEVVTQVAFGVGGRAIGTAIGGPVGGFVGGIVGDYVGGKVAPHAADIVDAFRTGGWEGGVDEIKEKGEAFVDGAKDLAKKADPRNWF
ncbi:hypothetical protein [Zhihengliuella salsuginis]|uniref:WXG100 family type VII secretion target n=1 Tax=Zhihengliuella salsuginis TaxID=578222 RepID=A0ABQ3GCD8_9MICC|nr:hypothetical protein [Zhihengliuella salsuginis]GHC99259.1 hypothetical protein GCM10008096_01220 [Zhihengliuella salsuginis]